MQTHIGLVLAVHEGMPKVADVMAYENPDECRDNIEESLERWSQFEEIKGLRGLLLKVTGDTLNDDGWELIEEVEL